MKFIVAQLCSRMHYAVPEIFFKEGMLEGFYTDFYVSKRASDIVRFLKLSNISAEFRRMANRSNSVIPPERTHAMLGLGAEYIIRRRIRALDQVAQTNWANRVFCKSVVECDWKNADAVYTFNGAGLEILLRAKKEGMRAVMEQTIAPFCIEKQLVRRAYADSGIDVAGDIYSGASYDDFVDRERREWAASDLILCGSQFVIDGIRDAGGPVEKCKLVPYGVALPKIKPRVRSVTDVRGRKLRVVMVGQAGVRKGTQYLLDAARKTSEFAEVKIAGPMSLPKSSLANKDDSVEFLGSLPRPDIDKLYDWADVFVLPTVCEGSATVVYEAMSMGLPVVVTPNAGSVVTDGCEGLIIDAFSVDAVADAFKRYMNGGDLMESCSINASLTSRSYDVNCYGARILDAIAACR